MLNILTFLIFVFLRDFTFLKKIVSCSDAHFIDLLCPRLEPTCYSQTFSTFSLFCLINDNSIVQSEHLEASFTPLFSFSSDVSEANLGAE